MQKLIFTNVVDKVAEVKLYGTIGVDINGFDLANEISSLNKYYSDLERIDVLINSMGGDVNQGLSICSEMLNSLIPCHTNIVGMAYSMAGVVAMCGKKRTMSDYGTFMMHDASGGSDEDVLNLITNSLAKIFEGTTPLTLEMCRELMAKETWMSPEECVLMGLVDEIMPTEIKRPIVTTKAELVNFYNSLEKPKIKTMEKIINHFKMNGNATEEQVLEKVVAVEVESDTAKAENDALKKENDSLKEKLAGFEEAEKAKEEAEKVEVVENAFKEGKIEEAKKSEILALPLKSGELKNFFASIKALPVHVKVFDNKAVKGERNEWTYSDWEKKDPAGLLEIKNSNPEEFKRLIATIK